MDNQKSKKKKPELKTLPRLLLYLFKNNKIRISIVVICIIISSLASVIATVFLQRLIDECIVPGVESGLSAVWEDLVSILLVMAVIYILGVIAAFTYTQIMATITQGTLKRLRTEMFDKMQTLPIRYFDTNLNGNIMSTYLNDTDALRQLIGQSMPMFIQTLLTIAGIFVMMLYYSLWMTILVCVFIVIMLKVTKRLGGKSTAHMMEQQRALAKEEGYVEEMMEGQKVIKVFCHEEESKADFLKLNEKLFKDGEKANKYGNILMPILNNLGNLMYVLLAVLGGILIYLDVTNICLQGVSAITIGVIVSFLNMSRQLAQSTGQVSMQLPVITMGIAGAGRVFELIDEESEQDNGFVTLVNAKKDDKGNLEETSESDHLWAWKYPNKDGTAEYVELRGNIEFENVDFGYVENKIVLKNISLFAKPGQKIAFVGATGAGKTTITNLINRFYDISDGKISYDGINIEDIRKNDLRKSLGIVLQDVNLFTGTVLDNIRYGKLNATDEECIAAAKLANADSFISRLPDGYHTVLTGNGARLSQGQRQLISIARAAVADPPVMILDEATSSIDTRTEALVQEGMDNLMKGRTVFVIAHRLSTVRNSNAIIVLDHGEIIERGSHDQLIDKQGIYYQLYTGAFELE